MSRYYRFPGGGNSTVTGDVSITGGSVETSGLTLGGLITIVSINTTTWTALPATPLTKRNAICIQNNNGNEIKFNYISTLSGYVGVVIPANSERFYNITDQILIYAKASVGTPDITIEEIS